MLQKEDSRISIVEDKNGKPILVDKKNPDLMKNISQFNKNQVAQQTPQVQIHQVPQVQIHQVPQVQIHQVPQVHQVHQYQDQVPQVQVSQQKIQLQNELLINNSESESSDEVFIENENLMKHDLTMEEMNAIDKQLEDINDNMGYESD